jgi:hypothetical protein
MSMLDRGQIATPGLCGGELRFTDLASKAEMKEHIVVQSKSLGAP